MKTVGLALSGGGARGFAHLGVVKALQEFGIKPVILSGASAGAMMGAFISAGIQPETILALAKETNMFSISHLLFRKVGLFDMKAIEAIYLKHFEHDSFDELPIPLYVAATDIVKGETVYYNKGKNLVKAIMASSCIPVVFEPIEIDGLQLLDGGILNNLPIEPLVGKCDKIIGVHVNSINSKIEHIHMKDVLDRSFHLSITREMREKGKRCDLFIEPTDMTRFGVLDVEAAEDIFEFGYKYTIGLKDKIEEFKATLA